MSLRRAVTEQDRKVIDAAVSGQSLKVIITAEGRIEAEEVEEALHADKQRPAAEGKPPESQ